MSLQDRKHNPKPYGELDLNDSGRRLMVYYPYNAGLSGGDTPTPTYTASISPSSTTKYNFLSLTGSTDLSNPTYIWTLTDFYDYSGNSVTTYTGQTTPEGEFRSSGTSLVSLEVIGDEDTLTASTFSVTPPTTYRMLFGQVNSTTLHYTDDMINYSSTTAPNAFTAGDMAYSPKLDMYVAGVTNALMYSYDGLNWTNVNFGNTRYKNVVWADKLGKFVSTGDRNNYVVTSSDGINWNQHGTFSFGDLSSNPLVWDSVNEKLILHDNSGDVWTSDDGITWNLTYAYSGTRFASIVSYEGRTNVVYSFSFGAIVSDDSVNWSGATFINEQSSKETRAAMLTPNGRIIGAGSGISTEGGFCVSDDGYTFTGITAPSAIVTEQKISMYAQYNEVEGKGYVGLNASSTMLITEDEGLTYTSTTLPFTDARQTLIKYNI